MPRILIPKESHKSLLEFARMPEGVFNKLMTAIRDIDPKLSIERFREELAKRLSSKEEESLIEIANELFQVEKTRNRLSLTGEGVADMVGESAATINDITEAEKECLVARLKIFGESYDKSIALTCKTEKVLTDHDSVFYNARIMTDIRPVFDADAKSIDATVIVHTLVLHYGKDGDHKDFYVALDTGDIAKLEIAIDRAKKKEALLQSLIQKSSVNYIS